MLIQALIISFSDILDENRIDAGDTVSLERYQDDHCHLYWVLVDVDFNQNFRPISYYY